MSQESFASLLAVPLETLRPWDSGRRTPPSDMRAHAEEVVIAHRRKRELLPLGALAKEFGIHQRTLQDAVRAGRLEVSYSTRCAYGRPMQLATRASVLKYQEQYYRRCYSRTMHKPS